MFPLMKCLTILPNKWSNNTFCFMLLRLEILSNRQNFMFQGSELMFYGLNFVRVNHKMFRGLQYAIWPNSDVNRPVASYSLRLGYKIG